MAMEKITQALALAPGHAAACALKVKAEEELLRHREAARIRTVIGNARNRFANGKHQAALQLLEDLDSSAHPIVAETLKELRAALHDIQERRRIELESARSQSAELDEKGEASRSREAGRQRVVEEGPGPHEEATMFVPMHPADGHQPAAHEDRPSIAPTLHGHGTKDGDRELTPATAQSSGGMAHVNAIAHPWRRSAIVGVLLFGILAALFAAIRPWHGLAPPEPPSPLVRPTFTVTLTGPYPFEVVYPGGGQPSAETHRLVLPAGATEVRLKNAEYFLDVPISINGGARETKTVFAPPLASLTVHGWNERCEIGIDGRQAGYHPLSRQVVTGSHLVSIRCPDGTQSRRVVVSVSRSEPITFTKHD